MEGAIFVGPADGRQVEEASEELNGDAPAAAEVFDACDASSALEDDLVGEADAEFDGISDGRGVGGRRVEGEAAHGKVMDLCRLSVDDEVEAVQVGNLAGENALGAKVHRAANTAVEVVVLLLLGHLRTPRV